MLGAMGQKQLTTVTHQQTRTQKHVQSWDRLQRSLLRSDQLGDLLPFSTDAAYLCDSILLLFIIFVVSIIRFRAGKFVKSMEDWVGLIPKYRSAGDFCGENEVIGTSNLLSGRALLGSNMCLHFHLSISLACQMFTSFEWGTQIAPANQFAAGL